MSDAAQPLYRLRAVTKVYRMGEVEVRALAGVDLDVAAGEMVVILGPSGSGKSTLLNLMGGMDTCTAGSVVFQGRDFAGASEADLTQMRRRHVGFVFQFYNLVPSLTALENVEMAAEIATRPRDAQEMLRLVGLEDRARHFPAQLSGGEQQRVAIARALVKRPDVLLCDEPTGALDDATGRLVLQVLRDANRELGVTVLIITHNVPIGAMAHRVLRMRSGEISEITTNETLRDPSEIEW